MVEPNEREKLQALLAGLRRASGTARPCVGSGDLTVRHSGGVMRPAPNAGPVPSGEHAGAADEPGVEAGSPSTALRPAASSVEWAPSPRGGEGDRLSRTPYAAAYVVRCACDPGPDGTGGQTVVDHVRLFPLRDDVRWTYRVHEQILPALNRARVPVRWTELTIRHTGYADAALRDRKLDRDLRLLRLDLADRPDDPFVLFNLGAIAIERHEWDEAIGFLERSLAGSAPSDSIVRKLFAYIARAHQMRGESATALETCARGLKLDPEDAELWFRKGSRPPAPRRIGPG